MTVSFGGPRNPKLKLIDKVSPTITYIGEAEPTTLETTAAWKIKRITFNAQGEATSIEWAARGAQNQIWANRLSLGYS